MHGGRRRARLATGAGTGYRCPHEAVIATEDLVAAVPGQGDGHMRARQLRARPEWA
jgi:hypothetical protein